jgi:hypothetical protein
MHAYAEVISNVHLCACHKELLLLTLMVGATACGKRLLNLYPSITTSKFGTETVRETRPLVMTS